MKELFEPIKEDIQSLYKNGYIENCRKLNENLGGNKWFAEQRVPMFFNGNPNASTVFLMLNPGAAEDYMNLALKEGENIDKYIERNINEHQNYGKIDKNRMDNFDLKQAAFLYDFEDSGIDLPNFFEKKSQDSMLLAKENVLMQKLQLELIPYCSREFVSLFDSLDLAMKNIDFIKPQIERIFDVLIASERKYIVFGSKQYYYIFEALKQKQLKQIDIGNAIGWKLDGLRNRVFFNTVSIEHKGKRINAGISYSFPRRDLPNAYDKMRKYGEHCYLEMTKQFKIQ